MARLRNTLVRKDRCSVSRSRSEISPSAAKRARSAARTTIRRGLNIATGRENTAKPSRSGVFTPPTKHHSSPLLSEARMRGNGTTRVEWV